VWMATFKLASLCCLQGRIEESKIWLQKCYDRGRLTKRMLDKEKDLDPIKLSRSYQDLLHSVKNS